VREKGEAKKEAIQPDSGKSIFIDFTDAEITSDAGFLLMREVDQRLDIIQSGCKLLHLIRRFYLCCEKTRRSIAWIITRLVKAGVQISVTPGIGMCMLHRLSGGVPITGWYPVEGFEKT